MKKNLLLLVAFTVNMVCLAQTSTLPLVVEGRTWNQVSLILERPESESTPGYYKDIRGRWGRAVYGVDSYTIKGDIIMDGIVYKKLLSTDGEFICGLREEDGRVYERGWAWDPTGPEVLLFDFNAQPGDIFDDGIIGGGMGKMQVKQVKSVMIGGKSRRCLEMWEYEEGVEIIDGLADYWIEGIGCMNGPYFPFWWEMTSPQCLLLSCYDGDKCIFNIEDFLASFPTSMNPAVDAHHYIDPDTPIYDIQGRRVQGTPKKGVYMQNGKKVIISGH